MYIIMYKYELDDGRVVWHTVNGDVTANYKIREHAAKRAKELTSMHPGETFGVFELQYEMTYPIGGDYNSVKQRD